MQKILKQDIMTFFFSLFSFFILKKQKTEKGVCAFFRCFFCREKFENLLLSFIRVLLSEGIGELPFYLHIKFYQ